MMIRITAVNNAFNFIFIYILFLLVVLVLLPFLLFINSMFV